MRKEAEKGPSFKKGFTANELNCDAFSVAPSVI